MSAGDYPVTASGTNIGVAFPTTIEALLASGPAFLTTAFRATGALRADNAVSAIVAHKEFFGGGMGRKLVLTIAYDRHDPGLPTELFAKFPRDFGDPLRDLFTPPMEPEVRLALLSRRGDFPVAVPQCLFADYDPAVPAGVLITERIAYGEAPIEPMWDKCRDDELPDPLAHYQALARALGRLAAYHVTGRIGPDATAQFPFDPEDVAAPLIPFDQTGLDDKLRQIRELAAEKPGLFPHGLGDAAFLERFSAEAPLVLALERDIRLHLNRQADLVALCHWNMNVDNAWFWRTPAGELDVGLLDWGSVGPMNMASAFFGLICGALPEFLDSHRGDLIDELLAEYARSGGPDIDRARFARLLQLSIALLGVAWMLDAPTIIRREVAEFDAVTDWRDPRIHDNFLARAQLQLLMTMLNEWRSTDIGTVLRTFSPD